MRLCFATNNLHKLAEVQHLVGDNFELAGLGSIGHQGDIPEDYETMEENSLQKAQFIYKKYNINCFADDSGLEVNALNGNPGVYSARYAGPQRNSIDNNNKVLKNMHGVIERSARFRAVISLILNGDEYQFEGVVNGSIVAEPTGQEGFGYDPIFIPVGSDVTFAQMSAEEKNSISHRGEAIRKLVDFLSQYA